jgi:ParB-like chromosome segregation protein Spo0J
LIESQKNMKTQTLSITKLVPYAGNPRKNDHAVEQVSDAIKRFGFRVPVLAKSNGEIIDGHLRVKAAKRLGLSEVPVVLCDDLNESDVRALRISINRMAELAEWDGELLNAELEALAAEGVGLDAVGFDNDALANLGVNASLTFNPGTEEEQGQLDEKMPLHCPKCGHEWIA